VRLGSRYASCELSQGVKAISDSNVRIVERAFELFFAGDLRAGRDLFATDVVVIEDGNIPRGSVWFGHEGVWRWIHDELGQLERLSDVHFEVEHLIDAGDDVIVMIRMVAVHVDTQANLELEYAQVWTIRDEQVTEIQVHLDRANAFASTQVLQQIRAAT
jgi:ketosteroid isomerase-like protein